MEDKYLNKYLSKLLLINHTAFLAADIKNMRFTYTVYLSYEVSKKKKKKKEGLPKLYSALHKIISNIIEIVIFTPYIWDIEKEFAFL